MANQQPRDDEEDLVGAEMPDEEDQNLMVSRFVALFLYHLLQFLKKS